MSDKIVCIRLDESLLKKIDWCIERTKKTFGEHNKYDLPAFSSRSHFIRSAIFKLLRDVEFKEKLELKDKIEGLER